VAIKLSREVRERAVDSIQRYFAEKLEDDIGDLKAGLLLDFFLKEIAPVVYNHAIVDAQSYFQDKLTDLDGTCYEPEFQYRGWE
jgi:uncharacterized protein (DUF2164 family)